MFSTSACLSYSPEDRLSASSHATRGSQRHVASPSCPIVSMRSTPPRSVSRSRDAVSAPGERGVGPLLRRQLQHERLAARAARPRPQQLQADRHARPRQRAVDLVDRADGRAVDLEEHVTRLPARAAGESYCTAIACTTWLRPKPASRWKARETGRVCTENPRYERRTRPCSIISATTQLAVAAGTEKERFCA